MYTDIGKKIKGLAKVAAWIGIIGSIIGGIITMATGRGGWSILVGLLAMIIGSLAAWISSWMLYGFGELVDKTDEIARNTANR